LVIDVLGLFIYHLTATEGEMTQVKELKFGSQSEVEMAYMFNNLFKEWLEDLTIEEKEAWLWNALVGLARIKQRRVYKEPVIY